MNRPELSLALIGFGHVARRFVKLLDEIADRLDFSWKIVAVATKHHGSVVDLEGNPLNDIFIAIEATGGLRGDTRTGEDGVFTSPGVSGEFRITTTDIDYGEVVRRVTVPCGELVDVELVLTRNEE